MLPISIGVPSTSVICTSEGSLKTASWPSLASSSAASVLPFRAALTALTSFITPSTAVPIPAPSIAFLSLPSNTESSLLDAKYSVNSFSNPNSTAISDSRASCSSNTVKSTAAPLAIPPTMPTALTPPRATHPVKN